MDAINGTHDAALESLPWRYLTINRLLRHKPLDWVDDRPQNHTRGIYTLKWT